MPSTHRLGTLNRRPNVRLVGRPEPLCPPFAVRNPVALISLPSSADGRQNYFNRYSVQQLLWVLPQQTHVVPKETAMSPKSNAVQIPQDSPIASLQKSVFTNCQTRALFSATRAKTVWQSGSGRLRSCPLSRAIWQVFGREAWRIRMPVCGCARLLTGALCTLELLSMRVRHPHRFKMYYPAPFWASSGKSRNCLLCVLSFWGSRRMPNSQLPLKRSLIALYRSIRTGIMT